MQTSILTVLFGLIALILGSTTLIYRHQLSLLQLQLASTHQRVRRDIVFDVSSDQYFPLYTQLSPKSIKQLCNRQWRISKNRTKTGLSTKPSKQCAKITGIKVEEKWKRPFNIGSASKCGKSWLITEFSSGYSLFEYQIKKHPSSIYTLPEAFEGTDFTSYCDTHGNKYFIYFSSNVGWQSGSILKFDLQTQKHTRTILIASESPLYNSSSNVDLEVDNEWLWVLYRLPAESKIAVTKFSLNNLKQASGWILNDFRLKNASNAFISCSTLYSVNFNVHTKMQKIEAVYNFATNDYLPEDIEPKLEWKVNGPLIQTLQYNPSSDSLDVFESGRVYSVQLIRDFKQEMPRTTVQPTTSTTQSLKHRLSSSRQPFEVLSNLLNSPNRSQKHEVYSTEVLPQSNKPNVEKPNLKHKTTLKAYVESYRKLYSSNQIDFTVADFALRVYKKKNRTRRSIETNKKDLDTIVYERKALAAERYFERYKHSGHAFVESGDFVVFEFFKVVLPLVSGSFDMCFQAFVCTVDEKTKTLDCDELTSFWCPVNKNQQSSVREIFLRRPSIKTEESDIYLLVHCYGNVVKERKTSNLVSCVNGFGISRIGKWIPNPSHSSLLNAQIDYTAKAVHIDQVECKAMDISKLCSWIPDFKLLDSLRERFLTKRARDLNNFLTMEMSNEDGLGDFDELENSLQKSLNLSKSATKPSTSNNKPTISKYVFNLSSQSPSISTTLREQSSVDRSSSGYGSVASSSNSSSTTDESVESNRSINFPVTSNSCLLCMKNFDTIDDLLLHLELRYPSLKFTYDSVFADQICVTFPFNDESLNPKTHCLQLNKSIIRHYRRRILSKLSNKIDEEPEIITQNEVPDQTPEPLKLNKCPLHFNPPNYQAVSFPGFYGIQRSSSWLSIYQNRKLKEFVDVTPSEMTVIKLWNDFQATIRTVLLPHQIYGASVIFVREKRTDLLKPAIYLQFIAHLSNLKHSGNLHTAEFYDIVARLQHGPSYDPRKDPKSYVYSALKKLEQQRQTQLENAKQNGVVKKLKVSSRSQISSPPRSEYSFSAGSSRNVSSNKQKKGLQTRKRTSDNSTQSTIGASNRKRARTQQPAASSITPTTVEVEKKRHFNTQTSMEVLLSTTVFNPEQVPISCFDDLACRYQFATERYLKTIWRFCRNWVRKSLE